MASLSLLPLLDRLANLLIVPDTLLLGYDKIMSGAHCIHIVWFEQVIEGVEVETLVQELQVDILGEAHQAYSLVLNLGHERLIVFTLRGNELSDEVLTIGFCDRFGLRIEDIRQVVMILLLGASDLNEG